MGTRSLTVFQEDGKEIAVMYRQYDGYLDGHGKELVEFLQGKKIVNGFSGNAPQFNGMGCLAAAVVGYFKGNQVGSIYLYSAGTRNIGEEYVYFVSGKAGDNQATVRYQDVFSGKTITPYLLEPDKEPNLEALTGGE